MFFKKNTVDRVSIVDDSSTHVFSHLDNMIHCYWWDETLNFGDWIGPWLISMKTGKKVLNTRGLHTNSPTIFSVGSILHQLSLVDNPVVVWGSGLIKPINLRHKIKLNTKVHTSEFLAVRGKLTHHEISTKFGVAIPEVYGDPALLLSKYYHAKNLQVQKIVLCPHHIHYMAMKEKFKNCVDVKVIDVKQDPRIVIDQIANAEICISSSLHGLIIAQTYQVPWMWLRVEDQTLVGDSFKFLDFYSTLIDCNEKHQVSCSLDQLSYELLLHHSQHAKVFKLATDLETLDIAIDSYL